MPISTWELKWDYQTAGETMRIAGGSLLMDQQPSTWYENWE